MRNEGIPVVAIVGRPNVGKSTLFNRITGRRTSLVRNEPGVTRDRHYGRADWNGMDFLLIDTGGFDPVDEQGVMSAVRNQCLAAIEEADAIIFVLDVRQGLTGDDQTIADMLRRSDKPVLFAANKADSKDLEIHATEFYSLGAEEIFPVAAAQGRAVGDLLDALVDALRKAPAPGKNEPETQSIDEAGQGAIRIALIGRPNAGKSSLLNRLLGEDRAVVHHEPGTTRDPVDVRIERKQGTFVVVDTAGIRRRRVVTEALEHISAIRALKAMERAHVACLVCDASVGVADMEARLASQVWESGRGLVVVLNKWDLVKGQRARKEIEDQLERRLRFAAHAPVVRTSALTGKKVDEILTAAAAVNEQASRRIATGELNRWLEAVVDHQPPPTFRGKYVKFFYVTQPQTHPPTFIFFTNRPDGIPEPYRRFLSNQLRAAFGFDGTAIRVLFRGRKDGAES